jgi:hypothetical protein
MANRECLLNLKLETLNLKLETCRSMKRFPIY